MAGLALGKRTDPRDRARRWILLISLGTNLGLLAFFKYANFVMGAFGNVVEVAGLQPAIPTLSLMLLMHGWRLLEERRLVAVPGGYAKAAPTGVFLFFILTAYGPTNAFIYSSSSRDRHLAHLGCGVVVALAAIATGSVWAPARARARPTSGPIGTRESLARTILRMTAVVTSTITSCITASMRSRVIGYAPRRYCFSATRA